MKREIINWVIVADVGSIGVGKALDNKIAFNWCANQRGDTGSALIGQGMFVWSMRLVVVDWRSSTSKCCQHSRQVA